MSKKKNFGTVPEYHKLKVYTTDEASMSRIVDGWVGVAEYHEETLNNGAVACWIVQDPMSRDYIGMLATDKKANVAYMRVKNPASLLRLFTHFSKVGEITYGIYTSLFDVKALEGNV